MASSHTYREFDPARDLDRIGFVVSQAFGVDEEGCRKWIGETRGRRVRVAERSGASSPDACLILIPMGQFFGGRSVPMTGVAGVAVAPESRGSGIATHMMAESLREMRASGAAISTLFPATQPVYRKVGYEQAGALWTFSVDPSRLRGAREPQLQMQPLSTTDRPRLEAGYTAFARTRDGFLDRADYIWDRVFAPRGQAAQGWAIADGDQIEGCVFTMRQPADSFTKRVLPLADVWTNTPRAARRALAFLADHASVVREVTFHGPNPHPLLMVMQEQVASVRVKDFWMLRIVDVIRALECRGYPPDTRSAVTLEVQDDLLPENSGVFRLSVDEGAGRVERASSNPSSARDAYVRMDVRDLASMYCGFMTPFALATTTGRVQGDERGLASLAGLLGGGLPSMSDPF